jgi:MFS family permease
MTKEYLRDSAFLVRHPAIFTSLRLKAMVFLAIPDRDNKVPDVRIFQNSENTREDDFCFPCRRFYYTKHRHLIIKPMFCPAKQQVFCMEKAPNSNYRYVIAASCFGIQAIGIGTYVCYGVFFNSLVSEFGWSRAAISGASSLAFFLMGLFGILVGRIIDKIGPRNVMAITGLLFGLGHVLMSRLGAIWQLYVFYGVVVGIGMSSIDVIPLSTIARWFVKQRGIMTGIVKIGTGAGQFIIPLVASVLIISYGWRTSYIIIGIAVLVLLVFIAQLLRRNPSQVSPFPDRDKEPSEDKPDFTGEGLSLSKAIRTGQFWMICSVNLSILFCFMTIMVHIVPHTQDIGISATRAASVLATIGGVSMVGRFIVGIAIDRIGSKRAMIICCILLITGLLWLQTADRLWMLYLFAAIYGTAHGGFFTTISPMVAEFFGIQAHGVLFGIIAFCGTIGGSLGPILAGYIFDVTASYNPAFWIYTVAASLGLGLLLLLRPIEHRESRDRKAM